MAAAQSAALGNDVTIIEKMPRPARKLMITGKGRCNVTNACFDINELIANVPVNARFLYSAFSNFMPYDTIAFFENLGVKTKIERGNRVFPESDKASDIVDALVKNAKRNGVKFVHAQAQAFAFEEKRIQAVLLSDGSRIPCDAVAVCTGGMSYSSTGSSGDGYRLARSAGHTVTQLKPSLVPLTASNNFISQLQGLSLKNVSVSICRNDKVIYSDFGEMLFTHFGLSGPVILSASSHIKNFDDGRYTAVIDLKPALDESALDKRLLRDFEKNLNKDFINSLNELLPKKIIPVIVKLSGIKPSAKINEITREQRRALVSLLKNFKVNLTSFYDIEAAVITSGGVSVKEIDPKTMRSKIIDNLYFAGEVIDVDAYTGGFNLQIAFSTGYTCGQNM